MNLEIIQLYDIPLRRSGPVPSAGEGGDFAFFGVHGFEGDSEVRCFGSRKHASDLWICSLLPIRLGAVSWGRASVCESALGGFF